MKHAWGLIGLVVAAATPALAETLTLQEYLSQVQGKNEAVRGAQLNSEGAESRGREGELVTTPSLFANLQYSVDQRPQQIALFGTRFTNANLQLGVSKVFDFGLSAKLYQQISATDVFGSAGAAQFGIPTQYIDSAPVVELTQSLWKNGFGRETRAREEAASAGAMQTHFDSSYQVRQALASAETMYWQLSLSKQLVSIQKDSLERSKKVREWSSRRAKNDLADRADFLQADAVYRLQELQLRQFESDLRSAVRNFNAMRGLDSDELKENLQPLDGQHLDQMTAPTRDEMRDDVKAAQQQLRVAEANTQLGREANAPTLDIFGQLGLYGRDSVLGQSLRESYDLVHPYSVVGLRFSAPLDFSLLSANRAGFLKQRQAAELVYSRRLFEQNSEWKDLQRKLAEAKERLSLARQIEEVQRDKADYEKDRLNRARTTTFQVLQFETDYNTARVNRLRVATEVLGLVAKMKTFGGPNVAR